MTAMPKALRANDLRRAKRIKDKGLRWNVVPMWISTPAMRSDGRALGITLHFDDAKQTFAVVAAEIPSVEAVEAPEAGLNAFLDDHAHDVIGESFKDLAEAQKAAAAYVVEWLSGSVALDACGCDTIERRPPSMGARHG